MQHANSTSARLLIVDDQESNLRIVGDMLGLFGYATLAASSGEDALRQLDCQAVDLILLDLMMPGRDGIEVCREVRAQERWAEIPIIFLSAADDKSLVVRALEAGGVDYVTKPFNQAELLSRVRTHLALKSARAQLMQLAEDKDELLGILAHDLKNHLGGMQMTVQVLRDRAHLHRDALLERAATNIQDGTVLMQAFVAEFLANSAADWGLGLEPKHLSLSHATALAVQRYAEAARRKAITLTHVNGADASVLADEKALDRVLDNLISNALKFSPPGKSVRVTVEASKLGGCCVSVQDEGPGFTEQDKTRMFRRYGRLSARPTAGEPSTGLGLSIVKKLVDSMGGRLLCMSDAGRGATFKVNLPGPGGGGAEL